MACLERETEPTELHCRRYRPANSTVHVVSAGTLEKAIAVASASFDMHIGKRAPWMRPEGHAHMLEGLAQGRIGRLTQRITPR